MDKRRDDIEKYLKGELSPAQMHALEKEALNDPFLADALEGAEFISANDFSSDVTALNKEIIGQKSKGWSWPVRIAASIVLIAIATFIVWITLNQEPEQTLALNRTTPAQDSNAAPTKPQPEENSASLTTEQEITPATTQPEQRSEKSSTKTTTKRKDTELAPELSKTLTDEPGKDPVNKLAKEDRFKKENDIRRIDPNRKDDIQSPSAKDIKLAEGYIAAIDARPLIVTGKVLSAEDGTPLPDVSIALKGTSVKTITDAQGRYTISTNSQEKTLVYSSEGLESTEVKINGIDSTYMPVKLEITEEAKEEAAVETNSLDFFATTNIYTIPAHPEIGNRAFKQYLQKNHKYPSEAKKTKVEGTVVIEFKVDSNGALSEFKIAKGIGGGCDEELIRLILQGAKWIPAMREEQPVTDKVRVKFKFELEEIRKD